MLIDFYKVCFFYIKNGDFWKIIYILVDLGIDYTYFTSGMSLQPLNVFCQEASKIKILIYFLEQQPFQTLIWFWYFNECHFHCYFSIYNSSFWYWTSYIIFLFVFQVSHFLLYYSYDVLWTFLKHLGHAIY